MHVQASYILLEPSISAVNQNLSLVKHCMLSIKTCQVLIDQSIRHSGRMHSSVRRSGIRHFGVRHSGPHPLCLGLLKQHLTLRPLSGNAGGASAVIHLVCCRNRL